MKIKGSEFDEVELQSEPVETGQILWNKLPNTPRRADFSYGEKVSVRVPRRININILDMTKLVPSGQKCTICDAGSISFGVNLYSSLELKLTESSEIVIYDEKNERILSHRLCIFRELTDYRGGFEVWAEPNPYVHVGLGSTGSLTFALSLAANEALRNPFTERELVKLHANNYVELNPRNNILVPGQSTGASGWVALRGGLCVTSSLNELVFREVMPEGYKVIVGIPPLEEIIGGQSGKGVAESDVEMPFLGKLRHYDRFNSAKMCYWTLMELMPAAVDRNMRRFGDVIWDMVLTGSKGVPTILAHGTYKPLDCLLDIRKTGAEATFVSSVGPSVITIASNGYEGKVKETYEKHGCEVLELEFDNKGKIIKR